MESDQILTLPEVAVLTRIPLNTLRYYRSRGVGPSTWRLGRKIVARQSDVDAWIEAQERATSVGYQPSRDEMAST